MTILATYIKEPSFPPSDQHPEALRLVIATYWVDYLPPQPTDQEVLAITEPTPEAINEDQQDNATDAFLTDPHGGGRTTRALALCIMDEINLLRDLVIAAVTAEWDPPTIAHGAGITGPALAVPLADFGDAVDVMAGYDLQGLTVTGYVSAPGTVRVRIINLTGASVSLPAGTWGIAVRRTRHLDPRTPAGIKAAVTQRLRMALPIPEHLQSSEQHGTLVHHVLSKKGRVFN